VITWRPGYPAIYAAHGIAHCTLCMLRAPYSTVYKYSVVYLLHKIHWTGYALRVGRIGLLTTTRYFTYIVRSARRRPAVYGTTHSPHPHPHAHNGDLSVPRRCSS
jgi:hypothetical protein